MILIIINTYDSDNFIRLYIIPWDYDNLEIFFYDERKILFLFDI